MQKQYNKLILLGNLAQQVTIFFVIEETKEIFFDFLQGTVKVF